MKKLVAIAVAASVIALIALWTYDYRSGIAKENMEKFDGIPTPTMLPTLEPTPIDPTDMVQVDTSVDSDPLTVNDEAQKQKVTCSKYERVMINGSGITVIINGPCRQIMVNGDKDQVTADAATEFVFNGSGNQVTYSRFINGNVPSVIENSAGNSVEKIPFTPSPRSPQDHKKK